MTQSIKALLFPTIDYCDLPKDEGIISDKDIQVYLYYNKTADKCYPFRYNGEGGNQNRFNYEFYCMRNCSANADQLYPTDREFPLALSFVIYCSCQLDVFLLSLLFYFIFFFTNAIPLSFCIMVENIFLVSDMNHQ